MVPQPPTVLITGANRGIGLGFVRHFLGKQDVKHVFACTRNPSDASDLKAISDPRLHIVKLDVEDDDSIISAEKEVAGIVGDLGLSLLVNNSGVLLRDNAPDRAILEKSLSVNVTGVIITTQVFLPLLRRAASRLSSSPVGISRSAIVNISSGMASMTDNGSGGYIAYRASKTALNSLTKTFAVDLAKDEVMTIAICPGFVQTRMTGEQGELTVEQSIAMMTNALETYGKEHSGGYYGKDGKPYPL